MTRSFERNSQQMRPIKIEIGVNRYAEGAVIINFDTHEYYALVP